MKKVDTSVDTCRHLGIGYLPEFEAYVDTVDTWSINKYVRKKNKWRVVGGVDSTCNLK